MRTTNKVFYIQGVFIFAMVTFTAATYGDYIFPAWADSLGLMMGLVTLVPLPIFAIFKIWEGKLVSILTNHIINSHTNLLFCSCTEHSRII